MQISQAQQSSSFTPSLLLLMWAAINVMDVCLTFHHLSWGGSEGNILLANVESFLGSVPMLGVKMVGALIVGLLFTRLGKSRQLTVAAAGMALVVLYNASLVPVVLLS